MVWYGQWLARGVGAVPELPGIDVALAGAALAGAALAGADGWLPADRMREVLGAYGIAMPESAVAAGADEAIAAARRLGYPVAIKLASSTLTHKTDVGGVVLDVRDDDGVRAAFDAIRSRIVAAGHGREMQGVVVQPMVPRGVETFVGATRTPDFGPLIGFGTGGINVELWHYVVFRVHALTDLDAGEMLDQVRGQKLLDGFRGGPRADRAALRDAILRVDRLVGDFPEIAELDINRSSRAAPVAV